MSRIRCEGHNSGEQCGRAATRVLSWATDDGSKHDSSMCASCFTVVRNMLLRAGENPRDEALPSESPARGSDGR